MRENDVENEIVRMSNNRKEMIMEEGLMIDFETADRITLLTLINQRKYLKNELKEYRQGQWLHPEDLFRNAEIIAVLDILIPYYGGTND